MENKNGLLKKLYDPNHRHSSSIALNSIVYIENRIYCDSVSICVSLVDQKPKRPTATHNNNRIAATLSISSAAHTHTGFSICLYIRSYVDFDYDDDGDGTAAAAAH